MTCKGICIRHKAPRPGARPDRRFDRHSQARSDRRGHNSQSRHNHISVSLPLGADSDPGYADRAARELHPDVPAGDQLQHHVARRAWRWR